MTCPAVLLGPDSPECNLGFCSWPTSLLWFAHSFPNSVCQAQLMERREFWVGLFPGGALTHEASKVGGCTPGIPALRRWKQGVRVQSQPELSRENKRKQTKNSRFFSQLFTVSKTTLNLMSPLIPKL